MSCRVSKAAVSTWPPGRSESRPRRSRRRFDTRSSAKRSDSAISQHQAIQIKLANMATKIQAARLLTYDAAAKKDAGERIDLEVGMASCSRPRPAERLRWKPCASTAATATSRTSTSNGTIRDAPLMMYRRRHQRDTAAADRASTLGAIQGIANWYAYNRPSDLALQHERLHIE